MHINGGASRRRILIPVAAAVAVLIISGCGVGSVFGSGSSPIEPQASQEEPIPEAEQPAEPDAAPEPEKVVPVVADPEEDSDDADERGEGTSEDIVAGTIELSIESGGTERVFQYSASDCVVSPEYILASGKGAEVGTGQVSEVGIAAFPQELLHPGTGTYQAEGLISVRTAGTEVVADGRMIKPGDYPIPSAFTYRHDDNSAHFVLAWFVEPGGADGGAGYVKVNCDY